MVIDGELYSDIDFSRVGRFGARETLKPGNDKQMLEVSLRVYDCINLQKEPDFVERYEVIKRLATCQISISSREYYRF